MSGEETEGAHHVVYLSFRCLGFLCRYDPKLECDGDPVYVGRSSRGERPLETIKVSVCQMPSSTGEHPAQISYTLQRPGVELNITAHGSNLATAEAIARGYRARLFEDR